MRQETLRNWIKRHLLILVPVVGVGLGLVGWVALGGSGTSTPDPKPKSNAEKIQDVVEDYLHCQKVDGDWSDRCFSGLTPISIKTHRLNALRSWERLQTSIQDEPTTDEFGLPVHGSATTTYRVEYSDENGKPLITDLRFIVTRIYNDWRISSIH